MRLPALLLQVCVRIRPPLQAGLPRFSKDNCIHAASGCSIAIAPPETSQGYKFGDRGQTYNFSRVFRETTSQQEYFTATAAPMVSQWPLLSSKTCSLWWFKQTFDDQGQRTHRPCIRLAAPAAAIGCSWRYHMLMQ